MSRNVRLAGADQAERARTGVGAVTGRGFLRRSRDARRAGTFHSPSMRPRSRYGTRGREGDARKGRCNVA
ncbi:hypothetical protein GMYAFLOJ_CDS0085 [Microbacterium phage phiMiGM15]